jgi:putative zinc finger/helix-turn-helix YgiT family protein
MHLKNGGPAQTSWQQMEPTAPNTVTMYCDPCGDDREFRREGREKTVDVRGEPITVTAPTLVCATCGATQPDPQGERQGLEPIRLANDEYRRRHDMLTTAQIRRIREQYDLSREAFAAVLGMSPATLYRYEAGALQDDLHDAVIFACDEPATMRRLVDRRKALLSPLQVRRFEQALARINPRLFRDPAASATA